MANRGWKANCHFFSECVKTKLCKRLTSFTSHLHSSCGMVWYRSLRVSPSTYACLSRSVPEIHLAYGLDVKQPRNSNFFPSSDQKCDIQKTLFWMGRVNKNGCCQNYSSIWLEVIFFFRLIAWWDFVICCLILCCKHEILTHEKCTWMTLNSWEQCRICGKNVFHIVINVLFCRTA